MYVEDSFHELKEHLGGNFSETVAAFANTEGGEIIIGVRDNGNIIGINDINLDEVQKKIENGIKMVNPVPLHTIERKTENGKNILIVRITKIDGICTYKGIVYYRHGSITDRIEGGQLKEFLASKNMLYFDNQICDGATIRDIDEQKLYNFIENRSSLKQDTVKNPKSEFSVEKINNVLINLGLTHKTREKLEITNAAILFFSHDPFKFFKQNEIRLVSFLGQDASSEILDEIDIRSGIPENVEEAIKFIRRNIKISYEIKGLQRVEISEYPERVLREAVVNAVVHRDYFSADSIQIRIFSNRIEFINPCTFPEGINTDNIDAGISIKRNPLIYQIMRDMHYMEGMATGIPMIKRLMMQADMPRPEYSVIGSFLMLTLYNKLGKKPNLKYYMLNQRQRQGLEQIKNIGKITTIEYAKLNHISIPTAIIDLNNMVKWDIIKKVGKTRGSFYIIDK